MRFRIEIERVGPSWRATIFDLADHGAATPYATIESLTLDMVMHHTSHYVLVAA